MKLTPEKRQKFIEELKNPANKHMYVTSVLLITVEDSATGEIYPTCFCAEGLLYKIIKDNPDESSLGCKINSSPEGMTSHETLKIMVNNFAQFNDYPESTPVEDVTLRNSDNLSQKGPYDRTRDFLIAHPQFQDRNIIIHDYRYESVVSDEDIENGGLNFTSHAIPTLPKFYLDNISHELRSDIIQAIKIDPATGGLVEADFFRDHIFTNDGVEMYFLNDSGVEFELMARIIEETGWGKA